MQNADKHESKYNASPLIYGSVCSGIEAATVAWHPLGWKPAFFSEIDPFPRAVLQHHFPDVPLHGDFTTIKEDDYAAINVLVGGTPCQAFSVAGLRKGFADERGNLALEFVRLAQRLKPRWLVWENVPGVLSIDGGRAFGSFLGGLAELGYGFAYRVLDAQHFGVPQRRRRVFVVGYFGDWRPPAAVLFESESLRRDLTPSREKRSSVAALTANGVGTCGADDNQGQAGHLLGCWWDGGQVSQTLDAVLSKGQMMPEKNRFPAVLQPITHSLRADGFDASEDGTGRGTPLVPVAYTLHGADKTVSTATQTDVAGSIHTKPPGSIENSSTTAILHPIAYRTNAAGQVDEQGNCTAALTTMTDPTTQFIAFSCKDNGADAGETAPTLRAMGHDGSHANAGGQLAVAFAQNTRDELRYIGGDGQVVGALAAEPGMKQQSYIQQAMAVRRLTPTECERLQGFPDYYTAVQWRGKPSTECPDGPRYKALGNSMAVPCMRWLGERIQNIQDFLDEKIATTETASVAK